MRCGLRSYHTSTSHYEALRSMHLHATHSNGVDKSAAATSGKNRAPHKIRLRNCQRGNGIGCGPQRFCGATGARAADGPRRRLWELLGPAGLNRDAWKPMDAGA